MWSLNFKLVTRQKCIGLSNTYHVDSLDRFRISFSDKVKSDICILQKFYYSNKLIWKYNMQNIFHKLGMADHRTCVYQFIFDEKDKNDTQIT